MVFTRNTTDSINLLAGAVPGEVVVLDIEHHANLLPWKNTRVVEAADSVSETVWRIAVELERAPAALLAITGASNVTGEVLPIAELADLAHACGARIFVDGAQLVPHRRVDLAELGVDYLAFSGHKLYAPFGAGVLVGRRDWLDEAEPYLAGGGAVREVALDHTEWACAPARHEAGSPNVLGVAAIAAACDTLASHDAEAAARHEELLCAQLVDGLRDIYGVEILRLWDDSTDCVGIVTFGIDGYEPVRSPHISRPNTASGFATAASAPTRCSPVSAFPVVRCVHPWGWEAPRRTSTVCSRRFGSWWRMARRGRTPTRTEPGARRRRPVPVSRSRATVLRSASDDHRCDRQFPTRSVGFTPWQCGVRLRQRCSGAAATSICAAQPPVSVRTDEVPVPIFRCRTRQFERNSPCPTATSLRPNPCVSRSSS